MQDDISGTKKRSFSSRSISFFTLAHATHHILTALPQPMLPFIQQEFNLNYTQTAAVTAAFSLTSGAAQLPCGWLADRIGPVILIAVSTLGVAISGLFIGLSHSYNLLIFFMAFMGLLAGGYHPASVPLISILIPAKLRGRAIGIHQIGGNASFFLTPLLAGGIAAAWGWHGAYIALAIPSIILSIFLILYLNRNFSKTALDKMKAQQGVENPPQPGYKRRIVAFLIMMVLGGGIWYSVTSFLSLYMVNELGSSNKVAAMALSIFYSSSLWVSFLGGLLADKFGSTKLIIITGILSGGVIFFLNEITRVGFGLWAVLLIMGFIQALRLPVTEIFMISQTQVKNRSTIYGIYYSTMQYTGAIFAPLMGKFIDMYGFHSVFNYSAYAIIALAILTSFFIWDAKG
jgi:FSR family fosmidomycin resistance protein-like MFS transporter